jgi:hypothetical protein
MFASLKKGSNLAYILILNLLYPAVLGSIFYSVFSNLGAFRVGTIEISCALMMISVVVFFSIDFLFTYLHDTYRSFHIFSDCVLLLVMQGAFSSINFLSGHVDSRRYCACMFITFLVFLIWDWLQRKELGKGYLNVLRLELLICPAFFFLAMRSNPGYFLPAALSITGAFFMVYLFLRFYRTREG